MTLRRALFAGIAAFALLTIGHLMMAQDRQFDPAQFQQRMMDNIKTQSGLADADFEAVKPKIQAVMEKRLPTMSSMRFGSRSGGDTGGGSRGGSSMFGAQMEELNALRDALSAEGTSEADIKTKLEAFTAAYKKRQEELKVAQEELAKAIGDKVKAKAAMIVNGLLPVA